MTVDTVSLAIVGSGGAGVMTCGQLLLEAAARAGWYGLMTRSFGPQIRGGEAAAFVTLSDRPLESQSDRLDLLVAIDWQNITRFIDELPLDASSVVITDPSQGGAPEVVAAKGPQVRELALRALAQTVTDGRPNMVAVGALAALIGLPTSALTAATVAMLGRKKAEVVQAAVASFQTGASAIAGWPLNLTLAAPARGTGAARWTISGNEAAALGALRGGVRFCAAYPITPATDILEWLAPRLAGVGGTLVQAEDELASINMCIGASFGGVPSITSTSGPGLALMAEALGLAVASETPVVVVNVMRGGPSTGIPTKSEQVDLDIALHGLHGDAPHLVLAPTSTADCLRTTQWAVHLAEALQTAAIVLSDQTLGQARAVVDAPPELSHHAARRLVEPAPAKGAEVTDSADGDEAETPRFARYAITESGVSPASVPGMPGYEFIGEGLEHSELGLPSTRVSDHQNQLDKRANKLAGHDFGDEWADVEGDGELAIITWGSCTGAARAAIRNLAASRGLSIRLIAPRLLMPAQPERMRAALVGVRAVLVLEMSHGQQFYRYLRSYYDLPKATLYHRPGPLPMRPLEVAGKLAELA